MEDYNAGSGAASSASASAPAPEFEEGRVTTPPAKPKRDRTGEKRKVPRRSFGAPSNERKARRKAQQEAREAAKIAKTAAAVGKSEAAEESMATPAGSPAVMPSTEQSAAEINGDSHDAANTTSNGTAMETVTSEEHLGMLKVLNNVYDYRTPEGDDPTKLFHRRVNKRHFPDYNDTIKEPMAMSVIKTKINNREYKTFEEFVRDFALLPYNAQVYNRVDSLAYQDALIVKEVIEAELSQLVSDGVVTASRIVFPFLGELPPPEEFPLDEGEEEEEDEDEDEEDEDDSDDEGKKKKKRSRASLAAKRDSKADGKEKDEDPEARKKRGRPPRVDTPMEARLKAIIKGLRKPKNNKGELMIGPFERMPDKTAIPEYFDTIKQPIAFDVIKKKLKRKKYNSVDQFMKDVDLLFDNAKSFNEDGSQIYEDAVEMQTEAHRLAEEEKAKPDAEYVMEDGRIPLPDGILHNAELWKVGDWIHIQNANDLTKPIVAQIYRTWQDQDGAKWVNACWYYRPEQTVHRFDRHFYENEVVKTGQYRDHPIDEVVDRCFVMFFTRFNKGRPRNSSADMDIYVCEARYNEEKHKLNKIKTWASCLPDEVRDKDYEMDLFDAPRKLKKVPSPIKYLFKEGEQKETDDMPKPVWGAPNAPPKIGAVHCLPRDPKDSPPPEPTPTPPPQPAPAPPRQVQALSAHQANGLTPDRAASINAANMQNQSRAGPTAHSMANLQSYAPNSAESYRQMATSSGPVHTQFQSSQGYGGPTAFAPQLAPATQGGYASSNHQSQAPMRGAQQAQPAGYKAPNPVEVFHLPDAANASIPEDIRNQFQFDSQNRLLLFPTPPVGATESSKPRLAHSTEYIAFKAKEMKRKLLLKQQRDAEQAAEIDIIRKRRIADPEAAEAAYYAKLMDIPDEYIVKKDNMLRNADQIRDEINYKFQERMREGNVQVYKSLFPEDKHPEGEWERQMKADEVRTAAAQAERRRQNEAAELQMAKWAKEKADRNELVGQTRMLDYVPPNEHLEWGRNP